MTRRAKSTDKDVVDQLLARQDDVIGELDKLESEILEAIESLNAARQEQQLDPATSVAGDSETIKMPQPDQDAANEGDRTSRAA